MSSLTIVLVVLGVFFSLLDTIFAKKIKVLDKKEELTEDDQKVKSKYMLIRGFSIFVMFAVIIIFAFFII